MGGGNLQGVSPSTRRLQTSSYRSDGSKKISDEKCYNAGLYRFYSMYNRRAGPDSRLPDALYLRDYPRQYGIGLSN